jgi:hypothetical protein
MISSDCVRVTGRMPYITAPLIDRIHLSRVNVESQDRDIRARKLDRQRQPDITKTDDRYFHGPVLASCLRSPACPFVMRRVRWIKEELNIYISNAFAKDIFDPFAITPPMLGIIIRIWHRDDTYFHSDRQAKVVEAWAASHQARSLIMRDAGYFHSYT